MLKFKFFEFSIFGVFAGIEPATWGPTVPRSDKPGWFYIVSDKVVRQMSVLEEAPHLLVNAVIRCNVKLTYNNLDCRCLLLNKLLHPFILTNGYPCETQPCHGDAYIHA